MITYPCMKCNCFFLTKHDLERHKTVCGLVGSGWRKSDYGGEWAFVTDMPKLAVDIKCNGGKVTMGGFDISLEGKYLRKRIARF